MNKVYEVVTYIDPENGDGKPIGTVLFDTFDEAEEFASCFEALNLTCLAFVNELELWGMFNNETKR